MMPKEPSRAASIPTRATSVSALSPPAPMADEGTDVTSIQLLAEPNETGVNRIDWPPSSVTSVAASSTSTARRSVIARAMTDDTSPASPSYRRY